jgi:predicted N-acyltransferase
VANFVDEERAGIEHDMRRLAEESPFKKGGEE